MYLYADDTVLLSKDNDIENCKINMQRDLIEIATWCGSYKLSLNINKTKCMLFGSRECLKHTRCPRLYINNICLDIVHQYKYLGVILDSPLTFNKHLKDRHGWLRAVLEQCIYLWDYVRDTGISYIK